jgi:hypothetical protein
VSTGHITYREDHRHDDKAKRERHTDMSDRSARDIVDDDGSRSGKDQRKSPDEFRNEPLQHTVILPHRMVEGVLLAGGVRCSADSFGYGLQIAFVNRTAAAFDLH